MLDCVHILLCLQDALFLQQVEDIYALLGPMGVTHHTVVQVSSVLWGPGAGKLLHSHGTQKYLPHLFTTHS